MDEILASMHGRVVPSITGRVRYILEVALGHSVILSHSERDPSVLSWELIERVYLAARDGMEVNIRNVDGIMGNPPDHNGSTMSALVLAMLNPNRVENADTVPV